jgi:hypothetical protein
MKPEADVTGTRGDAVIDEVGDGSFQGVTNASHRFEKALGVGYYTFTWDRLHQDAPEFAASEKCRIEGRDL